MNKKMFVISALAVTVGILGLLTANLMAGDPVDCSPCSKLWPGAVSGTNACNIDPKVYSPCPDGDGSKKSTSNSSWVPGGLCDYMPYRTACPTAVDYDICKESKVGTDKCAEVTGSCGRYFSGTCRTVVNQARPERYLCVNPAAPVENSCGTIPSATENCK